MSRAKCPDCGKPGYWDNGGTTGDTHFFHNPPAWGKPSSDYVRVTRYGSGRHDVFLEEIPYDEDHDNGYYCERPTWGRQGSTTGKP